MYVMVSPFSVSFVILQGSSHREVSVGGSEERILLPSSSNFADKWLNVILDLNGVLCVCEDKRSLPIKREFSAVSPMLVATTIGMKRIVIRPHLKEFLRDLLSFAFVSVWSSMKSSTTKLISEYLFKDLDPPLLIFGQEHCKTLKCKNKCGGLVTVKESGTNKDLFLKPLEKLFMAPTASFSVDNTIIVDDSPVQHVMNELENVVLPDSWSYVGDDANDSFLMDQLLPWIRGFHLARSRGIFNYRRDHNLGRRMLSEDSENTDYEDLVEAIRLSDSYLVALATGMASKTLSR